MTFRAVWRDSDKVIERDDTGRQRTVWARPTAHGGMVTPEMFGAVGDGVTDDAPAIQAAIDHAARIRGGVRFTAETYAVYPSQIITEDYKGAARFALIARSHVTMDLGWSRIALLPRLDVAVVGILELHRVQGVRVIGGALVGDRGAWTHPAPAGDNSRCLALWCCEDVTITGTRFVDSRGDGATVGDMSVGFEVNTGTTEGSPVVTVGAGGRNLFLLPLLRLGMVAVSDAFPADATVAGVDVPGRTITLTHPATATGPGQVDFHRPDSQRILLDGCSGDSNRRNGLTIESGRGIIIRDCEWTNTHGASPEAGIDVEPYFGPNFLQDVTITGTRTSGNAMQGMYVQNVRHARVRDCDIEDGIGLRGAADCILSGNTIGGGLTINRSGAQVTGNRLTDCGIAIYSQSGTRHRLPLDVEILGNVITSDNPDVAKIAVHNTPGDPPAYRDLIVRGNTVRADSDATSSRALITTSGLPASEIVEISGNTLALRCGANHRTSGRGIILDLAGGFDQHATIAGNRITLEATSTLAGAHLLSLGGEGTYAVHGNLVRAPDVPLTNGVATDAAAVL